MLQSPMGRMASRPMRNIETFSSQQMYRHLSLVERKVTEFYHNIDRRRYFVWLKLLIFIAFSGQLMVSLLTSNLLPVCPLTIYVISYCPPELVIHRLSKRSNNERTTKMTSERSELNVVLTPLQMV